MALKCTEIRDELQLPTILCQDACQRLMLHPYITALRTIINIVLSYVEFRHWTLRGLSQPCERGFVRYMPSPFYPSSVVLFQLHGGMVSHMQVLATHFSTLHNTKYLDAYLCNHTSFTCLFLRQ